MMFDGNGSPGRIVRGSTFDDADFTVVATPRISAAGGSTTTLTTKDVVTTESTSAVVTTEADVVATETIKGTFDGGVTFTSSDTAIASIDARGRVTRVGNGTVGVLVRSRLLCRRIDVPIGVVTPTTASTFVGFVAGSLARHCADAIDARIAAKSGRQIHDGASYQSSCWTFGLPLTGMTMDTPRGVPISPRHLLGVEHFRFGDTARFLTADGSIVTRTIVGGGRIDIGPSNASDGYATDITIGKLDADLPAGVAWYPLLPADFALKLPGLVRGVPCIATDQDEGANIAEFYAAATFADFRYGQGARAAFARSLVSGDSGGPAFLIVNGQPVLVCCWTFGGSGRGVNLAAQRAAIDAAMTTLGGGYTTTSVNLSGFPTY